MKYPSTTKQAGFTLIEVAIVLVIIGLLLGGVLKGQELIEQAKIKNVINDFNGTTAAFYSYQDRFNALPGDDPRAATRWIGVLGDGSNATAGNGNGIIQGEFESVTDGNEVRLFWQHLRLAGFAKGDIATSAVSQTQPRNKFNGQLGVEDSGLGVSGLILCQSNLPAKTAESVDAQFDDGEGNTGSMMANLVNGTVDIPATAAAAETYIDDGDNFYTVCRPL